MTIETTLKDVSAEDGTPKLSGVPELSALAGPALEAFKAGWAQLSIQARQRALSALSDLAEDNVELDFNPIFKHALNDEDEIVRARAIAGLWECEERGLITPLIRLLTEDPAENVRVTAAQGLGRFAVLAELGRLLPRDPERIGNALLAVVDNEDESIEVRRRALEAVSSLSLPRVPEVIREAYASEEEEFRLSAVYAMGRTCEPEWLPTLLAELDSQAPEMRYEAAGALGHLGEVEAVVYLVPLLKDDDPQVQQAAILALGAIGGPVAQKALQRALDTDDFRVQELVAEALETMEFDDDPLGMDSRP